MERTRRSVPLWLRPLRAIECARGWKRRLLVLAALGLIAAAAVFVVRRASLSDLPDVGDPFDVPEFIEGCRVPDERNAFVLYRRAADCLVRLDRASAADQKSLDSPDFTSATPAVRAWLDANHNALSLWLEGTELPDALAVPVDRIEMDTSAAELDALRNLTRLATLEATRRMDAGDPAAAWPYLRGLVRTAAHTSRHAYLVQRQNAAQFLRLAHPRILTWSQDPRFPPDALRQAIADLDEATGLLPLNSESIRVEYLLVSRMLDRPEIRGEALTNERARRPSTLLFLPGGLELFWFAKNEPERSRRVFRLAYANVLSQCDRPAQKRAPWVAPTGMLDMFDTGFDPSAPGPARRLTPAELGAWYESTLVARSWALGSHYIEGFDSVRRMLASLKGQVAWELYLREHGSPPDKPEGSAANGAEVPAPDWANARNFTERMGR